MATAILALVAACGGGTSQFEAFVPERYFAFGDESSSLDTGGRKYSVNAVTALGALDCAAQALWVQQMASTFGFVFAECNPLGVTDIRARMMARPGAKVADVAAQVDSQVAAGGFRDKDLATVLAGVNDILELYAQYPVRDENSLLVDARARGERLAAVVNRLIDLGAKVVVSNVPDMGLSPFALAQRAAHTDTDRSALLTRITTAFNEQLGVKVLLDGRFVGLAQADLRLQEINRSPISFGISNNTEAACTVALPDCTTATLVTGADASAYLWADATRLAPGGQSQLAQLAVDRALRNPF
ncbi:MAG: esterase [Chitinophagaceae bacterium]|nr:esterase [Rubrivivax sp.]